MKNNDATMWLSVRGIVLEENFTDALKKIAKKYQKINNIKNIKNVYNIIELKKQYLYYWQNHPSYIQQKKL